MSKTQIMVVEDEGIVALSVQSKLQSLGYEVPAIVAVGEEAIEQAAIIQPNLVLMDIQLSGKVDGIEAARQIRQRHDIPVIYLTANSDDNTLQRAKLTEPCGYLLKPFDDKTLFTTIEMGLYKHRMERKKLEDLRAAINYNLPHEFRTPFNGILSASEWLVSNYETIEREKIGQMAVAIRDSGQRLFNLTQKFSLYTQAQLAMASPEEVAARQSLHLSIPALIIQDIIIRIGRNLSREADIQSELIDATIHMSDESLIHIMTELLENACRFSPVNSPITVATSTTPDHYIITIRNEGRGLQPDQQVEITAFRQFERNTYEQQGVGLGLAIAKQLAELYGGQLAIDSVADEHTTVQIMLKRVQDWS